MKKQLSHTLILGVLSATILASCSGLGVKRANNPVPEPDYDRTLEILNTTEYYLLEEFADEKYDAADFAVPGVLTYSVSLSKEDEPIYFDYGWCASDQEVLDQNMDHIQVKFFINDSRLTDAQIHKFEFDTEDGMICADQGVLLSDWPADEHYLKIVATFDEKINDGFDDFEPGDYVLEYNIIVQ